MSFFRQLFHVLTAPFRWLLSLPVWVVSAPRRVMGMSMPMRAAVFVLVFLLICTVVAVIVELFRGEESISFESWYKLWPVYVMPVLIVVIPVTVYFWLKMWMEGDVSRFPDLDDAWKQGLRSLESKGIDIAQTPLFLVIGTPDARSAKSLFFASSLELLVAGEPPGKVPLQWYSDGDNIYLACLDCSCLSTLNGMSGSGRAAPAPAHVDSKGTDRDGPDLRGTMVTGGGSVRSTAVFSPRDTDPGTAVGGDALRGTLVAGAPGGGGGGGATPPSSSGLMTRREADDQAERLAYVCHLVRQVRQPVCPMNGLLTVLPLDTVQNVMAASEIPTAARRDIDTIRDETRLRCPVTALVVGMESETGFSELVRRVGAGRAKSNRFGKGYDVWNPPTEENMDALSAHACGAFEDWVYNLFREKDGLSKPGNAKLYALLCKIRSNLRSRLRGILLNGFSFDPSAKAAADSSVLFGGCYFAATGDTEDRQAFVKSVFEKMADLEEELEWTDAALDEDDRCHAWARFGMVYSGLLVLAIVGMLVYRFFVAPS